MPFVKGQSGNVKGANRREKQFRPALERALKKARKEGGLSALEEIAERLVNEAITAENPIPAIKEIADRLDGKPVQGIIGGEDGDNALQIVIKNYSVTQNG